MLRIPGWWRSYLVISTRKGDRPVECEVHFTFRYKGKTYDDILTLSVFALTLKEWKRQGYDDSPYVLLKERGGKIFAYTTPEELPYEFIDPKTGDYDYKKYGVPIRLLKRMVNVDVPRLVKTFRFSAAAGAAVPKAAHLSRKFRLCGKRRRS